MGKVFDPDDLHAIAKAAVGLDTTEAACTQIVAELKRKYPDHIHDDIPCLFNNAGGAMGQMKFLHCSLSEYLILFGTPIGTEGHSGRYTAEVWDFIFAGEIWGYGEGELERQVFKPGEFHHLGSGRAEGYKIPDTGSFMLEYARGPILSMMAFGLADTIFSTLDVRVTAKTARHTLGLMLGELRKRKSLTRA